jgi:hypothetical protein
MNSTEDLLAGALDAAAETVRPEKVRPLAEPRQGRPARRRRWDARLAPAAAAAAVVLAVAVALVVSGGSRPLHPAGGGAATGARNAVPAPATASPPRYYAEVEGKIYSGSNTQVVLRSTATGAVAARIANPVLAGQPTLTPLSVAAAPGDRTFYAVYSAHAYMGTGHLVVYRFHLTPPGTVTGLAEINGGLITGQDILFNLGGFAVSPDGSQLVLAVAATSTDDVASAVAGEILVINTQTGAHTVWRGGMDRAGQILDIVNVSWTGNGKTLAYLAQWCPSGATGESLTGVICMTSYSDSQVRALDAAAGGALNAGPVLLRQSARYPLLAQALIDPDGTDLSALVQDRGGLQVVTISVATGRITSVLDPSVAGSPTLVQLHLAADSTGNYLLLSQGGSGPAHGWIQAGKLRGLAPFLPGTDAVNGWMQLAW